MRPTSPSRSATSKVKIPDFRNSSETRQNLVRNSRRRRGPPRPRPRPPSGGSAFGGGPDRRVAMCSGQTEREGKTISTWYLSILDTIHSGGQGTYEAERVVASARISISRGIRRRLNSPPCVARNACRAGRRRLVAIGRRVWGVRGTVWYTRVFNPSPILTTRLPNVEPCVRPRWPVSVSVSVSRRSRTF